MTTTYQIIVDAYRQSNLISIGVEPTKLQEVEGLRYLNRLVKSTIGNEVGDPLVGRRASDLETYLPKNIRVNLDKDAAFDLDPYPNDGSRFGLVGAGTAVLTGGVNTIDGAATLTISPTEEVEYFFRADKADWVKFTPLTLFESFPFPEEFDDYFILMLAFRLNPAYERVLDPQSQVMLQRAKVQIRARYHQETFTPSDLALLRLTDSRWNWEYTGYPFDVSYFNKGSV